ncbi:MAG: MBL fold metallo-hydrolase [Firmicutes bacterium]|nr:MBL fold metallo-hydrolase [Bacillota bacterium]
MPELIQIKENIYYLTDSHHTNIGIVEIGDNRTVAVDSGMNDADGQMILAALESKGLGLAAIINTHSHADHYGGNNYLVGETACKVYAPPIEAAIMANPSLESFYLYGAYPPAELRQPFLMAKVSPVDVLLDEPAVKIGDMTFDIVTLKGHSPNQIGVVVDGVFFCSDSVFSSRAWERLVLVYAMDIGETIKSIEKLKKVQAESFVPSHDVPTGDITELVDLNLAWVQSIIDSLLKIIRMPNDTATILREICDKYGLKIRNLQQYYLCLDTLKAYLSFLLEKGLATYEFAANRLIWRSVG